MVNIIRVGDKRLACNNFRKDRYCLFCGKLIKYPFKICYICKNGRYQPRLPKKKEVPLKLAL